MNTLTNMNNFPIGNSLDGVNIITEEIGTLSLLVDGTNGMLADLNMNFHAIKNMDAGVDGNDAVNKSQLDLKADTTYVNNQLLLKADTTYVNNQLLLKADTTYVNNQLLLKADTTYVNNQISDLTDDIDDLELYTDASLNLLREDLTDDINDLKTYTDSSLNLLRGDLTDDINDLKTYTDSSLNTLKSYVDTQDNLKVNKSGDTMTGALTINNNLNVSGTGNVSGNFNIGGSLVSDSTIRDKIILYDNETDKGYLYFNEEGTLGRNTILPLPKWNINSEGDANLKSINATGALNMNTTNKIINVANGENSLDVVNKSQLDLKVNKSGDTMTGTLTMNNVLNLNAGNVVGDDGVDFKTNAYIRFGQAGTSSDWAYLRQIGGSANGGDIHLSIDFHDDLNDGKFSLRSVQSTANPDTFHTFFNASPAGVIIDKNATLINTTTSTNYFLTSVSDIYDYIVLTSSSTLFVTLPGAQSGNNTMVNRTVYVSFPNNSSGINFTAGVGGYFTVNGNITTTILVTSTFRKLKITGTSSQGVYNIVSEDITIPATTDQLTLRSQLGSVTSNREFTGIKFLNTNTDVGFIRVETLKENTNATMSFQVRQNNTITKPLELNSFINANVPILRNSWNSGELIKSQIYNHVTNSKISNQISGFVWTEIKTLYFTLAPGSSVTNSIISINFDISYYVSNNGTDYANSRIVDATDVTGYINEQAIMTKRQHWQTSGGGGTRSGVIFPILCSYTPSISTGNMTRTIKIYVRHQSDTLYLGSADTNDANDDGQWSCEIKQYKI